MRRLVLIRHAKSAYPVGVVDHDRPLNERGLRDAPVIGDWLAAQLQPDGEVLALVSTARRAQDTWAAAHEWLAGWAITRRDEPRLYEAGVPEIVGILEEVPDDVSTVLLVGHNPGLFDLLAYTAQPGEAYERALVKFPTSAVAVLATTTTWAMAGHTHRAFVVEHFAVPRGQA